MMKKAKKDPKKARKGRDGSGSKKGPPPPAPQKKTVENDKVESLQAELEQKDKQLKIKDEEIVTLKAKVEELDNALEAANAKNAHQLKELKSLRAQLKEAGVEAKPVAAETNAKSSKTPRKKGSVRGAKGSKVDSSAAEQSETEADGGKGMPTPKLTHINLRHGQMKGMFADVSISVAATSGASGNLSAHSPVLAARCEQMAKILKDRMVKTRKKKKDIVVEVRGSDVNTFALFLDFLYSGEINFDKLKPIHVLYLVITARTYGVNRLIWLCEDHLLKVISMGNVVELLKVADSLKDKRIRQFCVEFLLQKENFTTFVTKKESIGSLGLELFQEIVALNATSDPKKGATDLGECPPSTIRADFKKLYQTMLYADAQVRIGGETISFHRSLLAAHSKKFAQVFQRAKNEDDLSHALELQRDEKFFGILSAGAFKAMLRYVYYGGTSIPTGAACELVSFCHYFELQGLQEVCERRIGQITNEDVLRIMAVTYLKIMAKRAEMQKLRQECISHCMSHLAEINLKEIRKMEGSLDIALDLLLACQEEAS